MTSRARSASTSEPKTSFASLSTSCELIVRQQPIRSRMCGVGERVDRRPIDPPPILQLKVNNPNDTEDVMDSLHSLSPYLFVAAILVPAESNPEDRLEITFHSRLTIGRTVSSLYILRDLDNTEGAFFIFPDISVRADGRYRLRMCLFELEESNVCYRQSVLTEEFIVYSAKKFPGMYESCPLARHFAEQGLKIRIRKEPRKRNSKQRQKLKREAGSDDATGEETVSQEEPSVESSHEAQILFSHESKTYSGSQHQNFTNPHGSTSSLPEASSSSKRKDVDTSAGRAEDQGGYIQVDSMLRNLSADLEQCSKKTQSVEVTAQETHYTATVRPNIHHTDSSSSSGSSNRLNLAYLLHPLTENAVTDDTVTTYNIAQSYNASIESRSQVSSKHHHHHQQQQQQQQNFWPLQKSTVAITNAHAGSSHGKQVVVERQCIIFPATALSAKPQTIAGVKVSLESPPDRPELIHKAEGSSPTNVNLPPLREQLRDIGFHASAAAAAAAATATATKTSESPPSRRSPPPPSNLDAS
ncbi:hypothetical protein VTP01DRAFT_1221 [Rhizomucor pusillus]|uniref:uncharacterized protein n=1 Tax=Rhizomucor pusillus TaxID=4840 RepID=UPI003742388C